MEDSLRRSQPSLPLVAVLCAGGGEALQCCPQALQRLFMVELMLATAAHRDAAAGPPPQLPDNLRRLCADAWQDRLYRNGSTQSSLQQNVRGSVGLVRPCSLLFWLPRTVACAHLSCD